MRTKAEIDQIARRLEPVIEKAMQSATDEVLTVKKTAEMLGVSKWGIYTRVQNKQIPYTKKNGRLYFSKNAIINYYINS